MAKRGAATITCWVLLWETEGHGHLEWKPFLMGKTETFWLFMTARWWWWWGLAFCVFWLFRRGQIMTPGTVPCACAHICLVGSHKCTSSDHNPRALPLPVDLGTARFGGQCGHMVTYLSDRVTRLQCWSPSVPHKWCLCSRVKERIV